MPIPEHLLYIVAVQLAVFIAVKLGASRFALNRQPKVVLSVGIGIIFGILMDVVLGAYGIFGYSLDGNPVSSIEPRQLPAAVLLFNAIASYGLSAATVAFVADVFTVPDAPPRLCRRIAALVIAFGLMGVSFSQKSSVMMMLSWGAVILAVGEILLASNKRTGPFTALLAEVNFAPALKLWGFSIIVGICYETANWLFPFWVWLPGSNHTASALRILIVLAGYMALIHPIMVAWQLITPTDTEIK